MVILRMSKQVSEEFECEVSNDLKGTIDDKQFMLYGLVRPCERYKELYKSCKSLRNKLHQYYVYGELLSCDHHYEHYESCLEYRKTKNLDNLKKIVEYEHNLIKTRGETVKQNKIWEMRDKPPENFNGPLPDFIVKRQKKSILGTFKLGDDNK